MGSGNELARQCAINGFDLLVAADASAINQAAESFRELGAAVEAVEADLAAIEGVDKLYAAAQGRPVEALLANAGRGLGRGFLDQDFNEVRHVIDTNITGTIYLVQKVGYEMRARGSGRILHDGIYRGLHTGHVHSCLQRHQGVHRLLLVRPEGGARGTRASRLPA